MKIHNVRFNGFYRSEKEFKTEFGDYGILSNDRARTDHHSLEYIRLIKSLDKKDLTIVDFGGGLGGHYFTIKNNTDKNLKYHIIETPRSFKKINSDVIYYTSTDEVKEENIDVLYSNGTICLTKGTTALEHIDKFCKLNPEYILLQRTILSDGGAYKNFYTLSDQHYIGDGKTYYSITTDEHLKNVCKSYGYELIYDEPNRPMPCRFIVNNAPNDIGLICYKNYLFKK